MVNEFMDQRKRTRTQTEKIAKDIEKYGFLPYEEAQKIHARRELKNILKDEEIQASRQIMDKRWAESPGSCDYPGVDSVDPKPGNNPGRNKRFQDAMALERQKLKEKDDKKKARIQRQQTKSAKLISDAKSFLETPDLKAYLFSATIRIVKGELSLAEAGKSNELALFLPMAKKKYKKKKVETKHFLANEKKRLIDQFNRELKKSSIPEIKKELERRHKLSIEQKMKWEKVKENPADRSQRKARLFNQIEGNAKRMHFLEDLLVYAQSKH